MDNIEITIVANNRSAGKQVAYKAASPIQISKGLGITDAGATGHFLQPRVPAINTRRTKNPISISQPDGGKLKSTHECEIDNPLLLKAATKAPIVPGLAHTSLVSIKILIDAGCFVTYGKNVIVYYEEKVVWMGPRENLTGLWVLPIKIKQNIITKRRKGIQKHTSTNMYQISSREEIIKYLHQCLFCPPKSTLLKAIKNNQLAMWPGLTAEAVKKILANNMPRHQQRPYEATAEGY